MSRSTLKFFRLILPGAITVVCFLPLFNITIGPQTAAIISEHFKFINDILSEEIVKALVVVIFGTLYYALDLRGPLIRDSLRLIQSNIKARLLEQHAGDPIIAPKLQALREERGLINVFYHFIDTDASLKVKAGNVYFNGLFWTTFADLNGITMFAAIIYLVAFFLSNVNVLVLYALIFVFLSILSRYVFLPKITAKHIRLSNEQLEYILKHLSSELLVKLKELAQSS